MVAAREEAARKLAEQAGRLEAMNESIAARHLGFGGEQSVNKWTPNQLVYPSLYPGNAGVVTCSAPAATMYSMSSLMAKTQ